MHNGLHVELTQTQVARSSCRSKPFCLYELSGLVLTPILWKRTVYHCSVRIVLRRFLLSTPLQFQCCVSLWTPSCNWWVIFAFTSTFMLTSLTQPCRFPAVLCFIKGFALANIFFFFLSIVTLYTGGSEYNRRMKGNASSNVRGWRIMVILTEACRGVERVGLVHTTNSRCWEAF